MRLRRASADDLDGLDEVFALAREGIFAYLPRLHTRDEDRGFLRHLLATTEVWVAEESERVAGFVSLDGELLAHIFAHPQGRGVGSAPLEQAKERRPGGFPPLGLPAERRRAAPLRAARAQARRAHRRRRQRGARAGRALRVAAVSLSPVRARAP